MGDTVAFFLGYIDARELGLPGFKEHGFCPLCGAGLGRETRRKLGVFLYRDAVMRGPCCDECTGHYTPSLSECLDTAPRVTGWPLEPIGYHMVPVDSSAETDAALEELTLTDDEIL